MTIPSKMNPFGITKNKNKIPTDYVVYNSLNGIITTPEVGSLFTVTGTSPTNVNKNGINCAYFAGNGGIKQTGQSYWTQSNPVITLSIWAKCLNTNNAGALCTGVWIYRQDTFEIMKMTDWKLVGCGDEIHAPGVDILKWHHILGIIDNVNKVKKLYIDNQLINSVSFSSSISVENNVAIGGNFNGSRNIPRDYWFNGYLAAARIYNRVLSEDEIKSLASEFHPIYEITATDQEYTFSPANTSSISIVYSADGGTVNSFEIISGSLPSNISFDTSTGTFSGIATTDADHTYNLVIKLSGPDVIAKTINYTVKTSATSTLTATSPQIFNFTTEDDMQIQMIQVTRDDEYVNADIYSGTLPSGIVKHYSGKDVGFRSNGNQTEDIISSVVMALTTNYHPSPVYVTCNFNITLNQIIASNQSFTFYAGEGVITEQVQYSSQKQITPVYNISGTLPSGITFNSTTGEFTSDGSQTAQEIKTIQLTISSSTGYSKPAVIEVTLDVETGTQPMPTSGLVFYAPLNSLSNTAETGQELTYESISGITTVDAIKCIEFNNSTSLYTNDVTNMPTGNGSFTMSIWANIPSYYNNKRFPLSIGQSGSNRHSAYIAISNQNKVLYGTWGNDYSTNTTLQYNFWYNLVLTKNSTGFHIYLNGEDIGSSSRTLSLSYGGIYVGNWLYDYEHFIGYLAAARIYNRVLDLSEIKILAKELRPKIMPTSGLVFYWDMTNKDALSANTGQAKSSVGNIDNDLTNTVLSGIPCVHCVNDSTNNYVSFANPNLPEGSSNRTVSLWACFANINSANEWSNMFLKYGGSEAVRYKWFRMTPYLIDVAHVNYHFTPHYNYSANTWYHICVTLENGILSWYVNGSLYSQIQNCTFDSESINLNLFGGLGGTNDYISDGYFSSLRFYDRVLTSSEITQLAAEFTPTN